MVALESAKLQAQGYLIAERDVLRHKYALFQAQLVQEEAAAEAMVPRKTQAQNELSEVKDTLAELTSGNTEAESKRAAARKAAEKAQKKQEEAVAAFGAVEKADIKAREDRKFVSSQIKKAESTVAKERKKAEELREQCGAEEAALARKEAEVAKATAEKDAADGVVETVLQGLMVRGCTLVTAFQGFLLSL
jgi:chromosome segregation ATPase